MAARGLCLAQSPSSVGVALLTLSLCLASCELSGAHSTTPKTVRLGQQSWSPPPLNARPLRPATGLLLPGAVIEEIDDGLHQVQIWLDGTPAGAEVHWSFSGGKLSSQATHSEGQVLEAQLRADGPWTGSAQVVRGSREVVSLDFASPPPAAPSPEWPAWTSLGPVALDMHSCQDSRFPRQLGAQHLGCSAGSGSPPQLDRRIPLPSDATGANLTYPRLGQSRQAVQVAASRSNVSLDGSEQLVWLNARDLGWWRDGDSAATVLPVASQHGRMVSDATRYAFARADRIEVGEVNSSARIQLPASPSDGVDILALGGDWLAFLEGPIGSEQLALLNLRSLSKASVPSVGAVARPLILGNWLLWEDEAGLHGMELSGGRAWSLPLTLDRRVLPTPVDDWLLLRSQGGREHGLVAVHLPSGTVQPIGSPESRAQAEPRGAGAGVVSLWEPGPGRTGQMQVFELEQRVFEENGPGTRGAPLSSRPGGHGGSRGVLAEGDVVELSFDPGFRPGVLEAWIGADTRPADLALRQGRRRIPLPDTLAPPDEGSEGHWVQLGTTSATTGDEAPLRRVTAQWTGRAGGSTVDALRLRSRSAAR